MTHVINNFIMGRQGRTVLPVTNSTPYEAQGSRTRDSAIMKENNV